MRQLNIMASSTLYTPFFSVNICSNIGVCVMRLLLCSITSHSIQYQQRLFNFPSICMYKNFHIHPYKCMCVYNCSFWAHRNTLIKILIIYLMKIRKQKQVSQLGCRRHINFDIYSNFPNVSVHGNVF